MPVTPTQWACANPFFHALYLPGEGARRVPAGDSRGVLEQQTGQPPLCQPQLELPGHPELQYRFSSRPGLLTLCSLCFFPLRFCFSLLILLYRYRRSRRVFLALGVRRLVAAFIVPTVSVTAIKLRVAISQQTRCSGRDRRNLGSMDGIDCWRPCNLDSGGPCRNDGLT